ncbi:MAG: tyrosine-protein phosphatase [Caulobacterales bacterium]
MIRKLLRWLAAFSVSAMAACGPAPRVSIEEVSVHRTPSGALNVEWRTSAPRAPIEVYALTPNHEPFLLSHHDTDSAFILPAKLAAKRPVILLRTPYGAKREIAERVLPLEGGRNFRDLGGYTTENAESVRWGLLYRSGSMVNLTSRDYGLLRSLNIATICDFRSTSERENEPTDWRQIKESVAYQTRDYTANSAGLKALLADPSTLTPQKVRETILAMYRAFPYEHAASYRSLFLDIRDGKLPLAFNCSAGKDRTGLGAALVLSALGVPQQTILDDYALSDKIVNYEKVVAAPSAGHAKTSAGFEVISQLTPEQREPLLKSDPAYLMAALDEIVRREGSLDAYFVKALGLTAKDLSTIRGRLLEPTQKF